MQNLAYNVIAKPAAPKHSFGSRLFYTLWPLRALPDFSLNTI
jgi:hypothetical protein